MAGIINGTTNFILSEMRSRGLPFADVLAEAQRLGYAEADPTFDVEGVDAAHKLTLLASLAFGVPVQFDRAYIEGISQLAAEDIEHAERLGYRIKLLGITKRRTDGIELRVHPALVPAERLLANVEGAMNAVLVKGDAAVAFLGTEEANKVFDRCPALKDRLKSPVVMKALDWLVDDEKATFIDFLEKMDAELKEHGLTRAPSGLGAEAMAKPLWDVCRGRLRPLCLLLEEAVTALHRANDGTVCLTPEILAQAVEDHSIPNGVVNYNPFTEEKPE